MNLCMGDVESSRTEARRTTSPPSPQYTSFLWRSACECIILGLPTSCFERERTQPQVVFGSSCPFIPQLQQAMGYFGLGTRENKIAWTLIVIFVLLGTAFWIPGVLQYKRCLTRYTNCVCKGGRDAGQCLTLAKDADRPQFQECVNQHRQCRKTPIIIWALGWLFLVGFSWLPCFYFCCCAKDPKYATAGPVQQNGGVQMATAQPYGPEAHFTAHPFATQPYGPMPYYNQPPQQGFPPPPYSVGYPVGDPQQQQQQQQQQGRPGHVPVNSY